MCVENYIPFAMAAVTRQPARSFVIAVIQDFNGFKEQSKQEKIIL